MLMKNIRVVSPGGSLESIADMARSAYAQEGTAAFLARRPPQFNDR
jgi:hypothetical protein